jgi:hypothetical protein
MLRRNLINAADSNTSACIPRFASPTAHARPHIPPPTIAILKSLLAMNIWASETLSDAQERKTPRVPAWASWRGKTGFVRHPDRMKELALLDGKARNKTC